MLELVRLLLSLCILVCAVAAVVFSIFVIAPVICVGLILAWWVGSLEGLQRRIFPNR